MAESRPLVLICDDEPPLRELIRVSLGDVYRFREAATVAESMEQLAAEPPDLVVLDVMLPGGSGFDVLRSMRASDELAETPVVVVSAWSDQKNRSTADSEGADAFIAKPFPPDELAAQVGKLLTASRHRSRS